VHFGPIVAFLLILNKIKPNNKKVEGNIHPSTSHEDPEGE
jgi:hypothetical protein